MNSSYFHFSLCFKNENLDYINFGFSSLDELSQTWADWSEKKELIKKESYEKWLTDILKGKRKFKWGNIETSYDPKGGGAGIIINYK
jgi:hypothetical protein